MMLSQVGDRGDGPAASAKLMVSRLPISVMAVTAVGVMLYVSIHGCRVLAL